MGERKCAACKNPIKGHKGPYGMARCTMGNSQEPEVVSEIPAPQKEEDDLDNVITAPNGDGDRSSSAGDDSPGETNGNSPSLKSRGISRKNDADVSLNGEKESVPHKTTKRGKQSTTPVGNSPDDNQASSDENETAPTRKAGRKTRQKVTEPAKVETCETEPSPELAGNSVPETDKNSLVEDGNTPKKGRNIKRTKKGHSRRGKVDPAEEENSSDDDKASSKKGVRNRKKRTSPPQEDEKSMLGNDVGNATPRRTGRKAKKRNVTPQSEEISPVEPEVFSKEDEDASPGSNGRNPNENSSNEKEDVSEKEAMDTNSSVEEKSLSPEQNERSTQKRKPKRKTREEMDDKLNGSEGDQTSTPGETSSPQRSIFDIGGPEDGEDPEVSANSDTGDEELTESSEKDRNFDIRPYLRDKTYLLCCCFEDPDDGCDCDCEGQLQLDENLCGKVYNVFVDPLSESESDFQPCVSSDEESWSQDRPNCVSLLFTHIDFPGVKGAHGEVNLSGYRVAELYHGRKQLILYIEASLQLSLTVGSAYTKKGYQNPLKYKEIKFEMFQEFDEADQGEEEEGEKSHYLHDSSKVEENEDLTRSLDSSISAAEE